jgi:hypothetical protein
MVHPGGIAGEKDPDHPELPINMTKLPCLTILKLRVVSHASAEVPLIAVYTVARLSGLFIAIPPIDWYQGSYPEV